MSCSVSLISGTRSESVRKPWAIVVPNGPSAARAGSVWIHCGSPVASANWSMRSWPTSNQSVGPSSFPIRSVRALIVVARLLVYGAVDGPQRTTLAAHV